MAMDRLAEALEQFVNSEDWDEARRVVEQNKDLLGNEAMSLLQESIADYREAERNEVADYLEEHRRVLQRSREAGVDQAFQEANERARVANEARRQQLDALRPAQPNPIQAVVWQLLDSQTPEEVSRIMEEHPELAQEQGAVGYLDDLIKRADNAGSAEAARFLREYHDLLEAFYELPPVLRALQEFMAAPTWTQSRDVLKKHPELMSDEGIRMVDNLVGEARAEGDQQTAEALESYRQVLQRSRDIGPDQALGEVLETAGAQAPAGKAR